MKRVAFSLLVCLFASCTASLAQKTDFPVVVARVKLVGQTQAIPPTTIFTPKSTGLFRISVVVAETVTGQQDGGWNFILNWTGIVRPGALGTALETYTTMENGASSPPVTLLAGKPVTLRAYPVGDVSGSRYDVFVVIERLTKIASF